MFRIDAFPMLLCSGFILLMLYIMICDMRRDNDE